MTTVWIAERHSVFGDYVSIETVGAYSTPEKATAACARFAGRDTLNWEDELPKHPNQWLTTGLVLDPRDKSSDHHFEVHGMVVDHDDPVENQTAVPARS